jgi:hypothetical protein
MWGAAIVFGVVAGGGQAAAVDGPYTGVMLGKDRKVMAWTRGVHGFTMPPPIPKGLTTIFSNLGTHDPKGVYTAPVAYTVTGPGSPTGTEQWLAIQFVPAVTARIKEIYVAAGYAGLGQNQVTVSLYSNAGGVPGTLLQSWQEVNLPEAGACCDLVVAKSSPGIQVNSGVPYWIALEPMDQGALIPWSQNSTKTVVPYDELPQAYSDGTTWTAEGMLQSPPAFGIYGN